MKFRRFWKCPLGGLVIAAAWVALAVWLVPELTQRSETGRAREGSDEEAVERAFAERASGLMVQVDGVVRRTLADDTQGSRHQRFIVALDSGRTLLVAHNIDLAPRVPLQVGDPIEIRGQYEWNDRGGVLHWTHHDPQGHRPGGWIHHHGRTYQ